MELVSKRYTRTEDFRPKIEDENYVRMTFNLPEHFVCFADYYGELEHREVPQEERRLLGLMLRIARHNGYLVKKLLLEEIFRGMNQSGLFEDEDAEDLRQFVEEGIQEWHVHGPFNDQKWAEYRGTRGDAKDPKVNEQAA